MKKTFKGYLLGFLSAAILLGGATCAANIVKIVIDGTEITPRDANGKRVDPIIIDGTTYLPVRAVAEALGKEVYWDGPNYTVFLGKMNGSLEYPTVELEELTSIEDDPYSLSNNSLTDNYGNKYDRAVDCGGSGWSATCFEYLLNMKYSRFKGTLYVYEGEDDNGSSKIHIFADGKRIYSSPDITKTSSPVQIDIDITGCNNFKIETDSDFNIGLANAGFYQ